MTLEELQQAVNKDFKLDDTELDAESIKIPLIHNKYLQHFNKFKDVNFYKVNMNAIGTSTIDCEIDEWKDCDNLTYITQKEMVKGLDKSTKR